MPSEYQMFMCHLPHGKLDELEAELHNYEIGAYMICHEEEPYSHYHFLVQMTKSNYHNFCQNIFIKRYSLRGRALKDKPRQYGKVTKINDIEKAKSYTIKSLEKWDVNTGPNHPYLRTNLSSEEIEDIYENSFKKNDLEAQRKKLLLYLETLDYPYGFNHFSDQPA